MKISNFLISNANKPLILLRYIHGCSHRSDISENFREFQIEMQSEGSLSDTNSTRNAAARDRTMSIGSRITSACTKVQVHYALCEKVPVDTHISQPVRTQKRQRQTDRQRERGEKGEKKYSEQRSRVIYISLLGCKQSQGNISFNVKFTRKKREGTKGRCKGAKERSIVRHQDASKIISNTLTFSGSTRSIVCDGKKKKKKTGRTVIQCTRIDGEYRRA